jgi:hypothetical protein
MTRSRVASAIGVDGKPSTVALSAGPASCRPALRRPLESPMAASWSGGGCVARACARSSGAALTTLTLEAVTGMARSALSPIWLNRASDKTTERDIRIFFIRVVRYNGLSASTADTRVTKYASVKRCGGGTEQRESEEKWK